MSTREVYYAPEGASASWYADLCAAANTMYGDADGAPPVPDDIAKIPQGVSARLYREGSPALRAEAARLEAAGIAVRFLAEGAADTGRLRGASVLVTRARAQSERLAALLRLHGASPFVLPAIRFTAPTDGEPLEAAVHAATTFGCVIFTSATGVRRFIAALQAADVATGALADARIYAVGAATAQAIASSGLQAQALPALRRSEGLSDLLAKRERGQRALLVGPEPVDAGLLHALRRDGLDAVAAPAYRTLAGVDPQAATALRAAGPLHFALFYSPSAVRGTLQELPAAFLRQARIVAVGPTTAAALRDAHLAPDRVAGEPADPAVVDAVEQLWHQGPDREEG